MASAVKKDGMPIRDPFRVLGLTYTASESDVKKAYKQLALKFHPDKQSGTLAQAERFDLDKKFHDIKDARAFLLDADYSDARRKYTADLASERTRHAEDERRERTMSSRRKRMRDELSTREKMAATSMEASADRPGEVDSTQPDRFDVDRLRREGEMLREEYSRRDAEVDAERKHRIVIERTTQQLQKENRQVRLKWSRKKVVGGVHTKQSLITIMKDFGRVDDVELLGSKGNSALVTFTNESSCKPCVEAFRSSKTMRATFVGTKKHCEHPSASHDGVDLGAKVVRGSQDAESLEYRKLRQAAERERLVRQMEEIDDDTDATAHKMGDCLNPPTRASFESSVSHSTTFPPDFRWSDDVIGVAPFDLLERREKQIFERIEKLFSSGTV